MPIQKRMRSPKVYSMQTTDLLNNQNDAFTSIFGERLHLRPTS